MDGFQFAEVLPDLYPLDHYENFETLSINCEVAQFYALYMFFLLCALSFFLSTFRHAVNIEYDFPVCTFFRFVYQSSSFISVKTHLRINFLQGVIHD